MQEVGIIISHDVTAINISSEKIHAIPTPEDYVKVRKWAMAIHFIQGTTQASAQSTSHTWGTVIWKEMIIIPGHWWKHTTNCLIMRHHKNGLVFQMGARVCHLLTMAIPMTRRNRTITITERTSSNLTAPLKGTMQSLWVKNEKKIKVQQSEQNTNCTEFSLTQINDKLGLY